MTTDEQPARAEWLRSVLDRYERPLVRYAARITGDIDRACDAVQETFVRLCAARRSAVDDHLAEWLFTVCRTRALDSRRKERRMRPLAAAHAETCESPEPAPPAVTERRETAGQLLRVLDTLPANQQEVIRLKFQEGLSYREIARITDRTVSNVGFLIHCGLRTLREKLGSDAGPAPHAARRVP